MRGCDGSRRGYYFGREPIGRAGFEVRVGNLKKGKVAGKYEITGEIVKGGEDRVVDWIWRLEGGEARDRKEGNEIPGGWEGVEIVRPLVCR